MKTPDEVKKGLECLLGLCEGADCDECTRNVYEAYEIIRDDHIKDSLAYIQQLEQELAAVKREKDAAVEAVEMYPCFTCKNISSAHCKDCLRNRSLVLDRFTKYLPDNYEWRVVCPENTEVQYK